MFPPGIPFVIPLYVVHHAYIWKSRKWGSDHKLLALLEGQQETSDQNLQPYSYVIASILQERIVDIDSMTEYKILEPKLFAETVGDDMCELHTLDIPNILSL
ncbi:MAG: hypothetical protein MMC33_006307 [Icmadophila ericetorum]|nr:hypothetical protein [Icmadophila ericetorum]